MGQLNIGDKASEFYFKDQEGNEKSLKDCKGKKVILYFYPKDDTPGCTAEACNLRDNYSRLLKLGYLVIGVSADDENAHKKFIAKYNLPFPLIPDVDKKIIKAYGAWGEKQLYGKTYEGIIRTTFVIDENGNIEEIITNVKPKDHTNQILE